MSEPPIAHSAAGHTAPGGAPHGQGDAPPPAPARGRRRRDGRAGGIVTLAPSPEESEEWVISYMDMVTLLMIVFLGMVAILGIKGRLKMADQVANQPGAGAVAVAKDADGAPSGGADGDATAATRTREPQTGDETPMDIPRVRMVPLSGGGDEGPDRTQMTSGPGATAGPDATGIAGRAPLLVPPGMAPGLRRLVEQLQAADLPDDVQLTLSAHDVSIEIKDRLLFASGKADIGEEGEAVLTRLAPSLSRLPGVITVEGHTDSVAIATARYPSNWELSAARAATVVRLLIAHGVPPTRLRAVGYADTQPRDVVDKAANRRVTIQVAQP